MLGYHHFRKSPIRLIRWNYNELHIQHHTTQKNYDLPFVSHFKCHLCWTLFTTLTASPIAIARKSRGCDGGRGFRSPLSSRDDEPPQLGGVHLVLGDGFPWVFHRGLSPKWLVDVMVSILKILKWMMKWGTQKMRKPPQPLYMSVDTLRGHQWLENRKSGGNQWETQHV